MLREGFGFGPIEAAVVVGVAMASEGRRKPKLDEKRKGIGVGLCWSMRENKFFRDKVGILKIMGVQKKKMGMQQEMDR